jgi:SAM-dependent methyltransferase
MRPRSNPRRESAERFDPETMNGLIEAEHRARYYWAAQAVQRKEVLDAACGLGYGCTTLAGAGAARVVGVDVDSETVAAARARANGVVEFVDADIRALPFPDGSFDTITCFEAIEHLENPDDAFDEFARVLRPGGILFVSSPNRDVYTPGNPHHFSEYVPAEFDGALRRRWKNVQLFRQHPYVASLVTDDEGLAADDPNRELDVSLRKTTSTSAGAELYTLAAASDGPVPALRPVALLTSTVDLRAWQEKVWALELALARRTLNGLMRGVARRSRAAMHRLRRQRSE